VYACVLIVRLPTSSTFILTNNIVNTTGKQDNSDALTVDLLKELRLVATSSARMEKIVSPFVCLMGISQGTDLLVNANSKSKKARSLFIASRRHLAITIIINNT